MKANQSYIPCLTAFGKQSIFYSSADNSFLYKKKWDEKNAMNFDEVIRDCCMTIELYIFISSLHLFKGYCIKNSKVFSVF